MVMHVYVLLAIQARFQNDLMDSSIGVVMVWYSTDKIEKSSQ